ncbi:hypothetical protein XACJJ10_2410024 [Xanthomonas citri pv. citri]|nr:hypothetical protein XAC40_1390034 [Xanthomonas citri pv. citri]CEH83805.1 hypothetical protein XAC3612_2890003 [Xanthomonas citri pv. citri]CEI02883.1 hypothetical protein XACG117_3130023 [Xanthomonas citri pv. citri]CEI36791.1 hypothetical protein XACJJ10_2410024 [Xanthomonas citri pv. citri]
MDVRMGVVIVSGKHVLATAELSRCEVPHGSLHRVPVRPWRHRQDDAVNLSPPAVALRYRCASAGESAQHVPYVLLAKVALAVLVLQLDSAISRYVLHVCAHAAHVLAEDPPLSRLRVLLALGDLHHHLGHATRDPVDGRPDGRSRPVRLWRLRACDLRPSRGALRLAGLLVCDPGGVGEVRQV